MVPYPTTPHQEPQIPPKIAAALQYLHFAQGIRTATGSSVFDGRPNENLSRELSKPEMRAYDAALAALTEYFNSDDVPLSQRQNPDRPPPPIAGDPQPVPVS